jgi:hypothetical protein
MKLKKYYQSTEVSTNKTENCLEFDNGLVIHISEQEYNKVLNKVKKPVSKPVLLLEDDGVQEL